MNKLATLAKIATRLDSLGLTKEADILDAFIRKVATDATPAGMNATPSAPSASGPLAADQIYTTIANDACKWLISKAKDVLKTYPDIVTNQDAAKAALAVAMEEVRKLKYSSDLGVGITEGNVATDVPRFIPFLQNAIKAETKIIPQSAKDWDSYVSRTSGGQDVKDTWIAYAKMLGDPNITPDYSSFVAWWMDHRYDSSLKSPAGVVKSLKAVMTTLTNSRNRIPEGVSREKAAEQLADQRWSQSVTEALSSVPRDAASGFKAAYDEL